MLAYRLAHAIFTDVLGLIVSKLLKFEQKQRQRTGDVDDVQR